MIDQTWVDCRYTLALFEKPVVIKPPEVVASHDFLLLGWILLLLMGLPWVIVVIDAVVVGIMGYLGYTPWVIIAMLSTPSTIINSFTAYFALAFNWTQTLALGAGGLAFFLIVILTIYGTTVRRTSTGNYEGARAASLFYGIMMILISLVSLAAFIGFTYAASAAILIFPALFFFMGYGKMGEVIARYGPMAVLSDAAPVETMPQIPGGAAVPPMPVMAAPAMGMGAVAVQAVPSSPVPMPTQPVSPHYQHLGAAVPQVPLCPGCGRELYYASNYKRWYCLVCESRR